MPHIAIFESDILAISLETEYKPPSYDRTYSVVFLKRVSDNGVQESWIPYNDFAKKYPSDRRNIRVGSSYCGSSLDTYQLDLYVPFAAKGTRRIRCNLSNNYIQLDERCIPIIERSIDKYNDSFPRSFVSRISNIQYDSSCSLTIREWKYVSEVLDNTTTQEKPLHEKWILTEQTPAMNHTLHVVNNAA